jgi:hypothetical protein
MDVELNYDTVALRGTEPIGMLILHVVQVSGLVVDTKSGVCDPFVQVRCAFSDRNLHSRMPSDPTHVRFIPLGSPLPLTVATINHVETLKAVYNSSDLNDISETAKRTKTMKKTVDPLFDEELCFEEVGSLETAAGGSLTIQIFAQLGKRKEQLLGSVVLPVGLGVDHGEPITIPLQSPDLAGDAIAMWSPFSPDEQMVRCAVFRQKFTLEDAIGSRACSFEANMRVTNGILLGSSLLLPVHTVNSVQTWKALQFQQMDVRCSSLCISQHPLATRWP